MRLSSRFGFDVLLLAVAVGAAVLAVSYDPRAGRIPVIVAVGAAALLAVQAAMDLRVPRPGGGDAGGEPGRARGADHAGGEDWTAAGGDEGVSGWRWPAVVMLALVAFVFLVWLVGYLIAVPIFTYGALVLLGRSGWRVGLLVTVAMWGFVYLVLEVLLRANLS